MRILHYIHQLKSNDLLSDYVQSLVSSFEGLGEAYVATFDSNIQEVLDERNPDIIHIHGCWDRYAYRFTKTAISQGHAVVLSPHGEIGTYAMKHEHRLAKRIKIADYQRWMLKNSEALLVTTEEEREKLLAVGWQDRIDVIKASLLDSSITDEEMAQQLLLFYGKVIDTRYRQMMADSEKEAIRSLIHVGMAHDETMTLLDSQRLLTLRALTPTQWRHILLYGDDEDMRGIIDAAAQRLQLPIPNIDTSSISRYDARQPKAKGELPADRLIGGNKLLARKVKYETQDDPDVLKELTKMFFNARTLISKRQMSMRQMAELYDAVKYEDYDESRFREIMKDLKLKNFTRRMIQILADEAYLEEGFMPDDPKNDNTTRKIKAGLLADPNK